jgi:hypothetical protein
MYDNIGDKIKLLAKILFALGAIAAIITGIVLIYHEETRQIAWIVIVAGPLISWASSWLVYGFGELIDNTNSIAFYTNRMIYYESEASKDNATNKQN